jgi:hypothetical protein
VTADQLLKAVKRVGHTLDRLYIAASSFGTLVCAGYAIVGLWRAWPIATTEGWAIVALVLCSVTTTDRIERLENRRKARKP